MPILILRSHLHPSPWARGSGYAACAGLGREVNMNKRNIAHIGIGIQAENRPDAISQRGPYRRMNLLPIKTNGNFPLWLIFKQLSCKSFLFCRTERRTGIAAVEGWRWRGGTD